MYFGVIFFRFLLLHVCGIIGAQFLSNSESSQSLFLQPFFCSFPVTLGDFDYTHIGPWQISPHVLMLRSLFPVFILSVSLHRFCCYDFQLIFLQSLMFCYSIQQSFQVRCCFALMGVFYKIYPHLYLLCSSFLKDTVCPYLLILSLVLFLPTFDW